MQHLRAAVWQALLWLASKTSMPAWVWMDHYDIPTRQYTRVTDGGTEIRMVPPLPEPSEFQRGTHIVQTQMADGFVPPCGRLVAGQAQPQQSPEPVEVRVHIDGKAVYRAMEPYRRRRGGGELA